MLKPVFKYTLRVASYKHRECRTTLWRRAGDGDWTTGGPVAPYAAEWKFLGANKQPVVRGGWSSMCVLICVCGEDEKKKKRWWWWGGVVGFAAREVKRPPRPLRQRR